jgi:hypothetical protein
MQLQLVTQIQTEWEYTVSWTATLSDDDERSEKRFDVRDVREFLSVGLSGARGKMREMGTFLTSREAAQPCVRCNQDPTLY